jgi:hypothetical protein
VVAAPVIQIATDKLPALQTVDVVNPANVQVVAAPVIQIATDKLPAPVTRAVHASDKLAQHGQANRYIWSPKILEKIHTSSPGLQITDGGFETYTPAESLTL